MEHSCRMFIQSRMKNNLSVAPILTLKLITDEK